MTPCSGSPPRQAAASWRLDLHAGCQDTRQRPWPASFTNRALDRPSAFLRLPVGRLPAGSQLGRVVLRHLFLQPPTKRRMLAKAPESCPSPPSADGRGQPKTAPDSSPETCRSVARQGHDWAHGSTDRLWPARTAHQAESADRCGAQSGRRASKDRCVKCSGPSVAGREDRLVDPLQPTTVLLGSDCCKSKLDLRSRCQDI